MVTLQPLENINIGGVCRACFETCEQYKMLFEDAENAEKRSLGDVFFDVVKIEKAEIESSPSRICLPCSKDLISAYKFIQKSQENNERFMMYLRNSIIKQSDCLSEFPIDIPDNPNIADFLQIKVENEAISEYAGPLLDDKNSPSSSSESVESDDDASSLYVKEKINKMQCTYCNRIFKRLDFLENHKKKHEEEMKKKEDEFTEGSSVFLCDECGISCSSKLELKTHRTTNHTTSVMSSERESSVSSANQINSIDKSEDGCFRLQSCPVEIKPPPPPPISKDNSDILMLKTEINNLRETCLKEFSELKELILKQNEIKESSHKKKVIEEHQAALQYPLWEFDKLFPINSEEKLMTLNNLNDTQKLVAVTTVRQLIYQGGLCSNMNRLFGNRIIVNYNYEGKRGKKSLKDLANVNEILFRAACRNGYTMVDYENDLRKGFKIMKNRYFKNECMKRKKVDYKPDSQIELQNVLVEMSN